MGRLGAPEWLAIILLVVLLFGAKRLPDAARGLGRSLRIFKAETKGLVEDSTPAALGDSAKVAGEQGLSGEQVQAKEAPPAA